MSWILLGILSNSQPFWLWSIDKVQNSFNSIQIQNFFNTWQTIQDLVNHRNFRRATYSSCVDISFRNFLVRKQLTALPLASRTKQMVLPLLMGFCSVVERRRHVDGDGRSHDPRQLTSPPLPSIPSHSTSPATPPHDASEIQQDNQDDFHAAPNHPFSHITQHQRHSRAHVHMRVHEHVRPEFSQVHTWEFGQS